MLYRTSSAQHAERKRKGGKLKINTNKLVAGEESTYYNRLNGLQNSLRIKSNYQQKKRGIRRIKNEKSKVDIG